MRVCEPVIVEGTAPKKNPSESGRSKASGGFRQKPGHDLILWTGALERLWSQLLGLKPCFPQFLAVKPWASYLISLCLDFLICKLGLLIIISHNLLGVFRGTNELISAKWLELAWHIVNAELITDIKPREAMERSAGHGTEETSHGEEIVHAASWAEEPLSANCPAPEPKKRNCSCGPCRKVGMKQL